MCVFPFIRYVCIKMKECAAGICSDNKLYNVLCISLSVPCMRSDMRYCCGLYRYDHVSSMVRSMLGYACVPVPMLD